MRGGKRLVGDEDARRLNELARAECRRLRLASILSAAASAVWIAQAFTLAQAVGDAMRSSPSAEVRRFLGADKDFGRQLGLAPDWTHRMIKQVGNYGEIFERDLGLRSPVKLERRLNNLATKGGLHYAPSFR
jgi:hypothetical protein